MDSSLLIFGALAVVAYVVIQRNNGAAAAAAAQQAALQRPGSSLDLSLGFRKFGT